MKSHDVRIFNIQVNKLAQNRKSYTVRWRVATRPRFSQTFATRALADNYRSDLKQAANRGEAFDLDTGLPESMVEAVHAPERTWLDFVLEYVTMKWPGAAAKSRGSMIDALVTVTPVLVADAPGRPESEQLRAVLRDYLVPPNVRDREQPADVVAVARWLQAHSLPLSALADPVNARAGLNAAGLKMDGKPAAATTNRRKRSVFYNVLQYAVELELLEFNPVDKVRVTSRRSKIVEAVDRRVVANPAQARQLLAAVTYVGQRGRGARLQAFFACMYFGGLRPGEAQALCESNCHLPARCEDCGDDLTGNYSNTASTTCGHQRVTYSWGRLTLETNRPTAGKRWTDSGEVHDDRGLKHRGQDEARGVPIPPELVQILREHLAQYGVSTDGRIFASRAGGVVGSAYSLVWKQARIIGLSPHQQRSPLAARPYDLRHGALSLWFNAGVPATEVAERAGNSVDVLLKIYAKCIDGQAEVVNQRIEDALGS